MITITFTRSKIARTISLALSFGLWAGAIGLPVQAEGIAIGEPNSSAQLKLTILDKNTHRPIVNRTANIHSDNGIRCVMAPCPTNSQNWQGRTDRQGVVFIPQSLIQNSTILTVRGYNSTAIPPKSSDAVTVLMVAGDR